MTDSTLSSIFIPPALPMRAMVRKSPTVQPVNPVSTLFIDTLAHLHEESVSLSERPTTIQATTLHWTPSLQGIEARIDKLEETLKNSWNRLTSFKQGLQEIEKNTESSSSTRSQIQTIQQWVADFVLRGGTTTAQSSLSLILETRTECADLHFVNMWIKLVTDVLDFGSGLSGIIYQKFVLNLIQEEIDRLKLHAHELQPDEQQRLSELEQTTKHEQTLLPESFLEQALRTVRIAASYATFTFSWAEQVTLISSLSLGMSSLIAGVNTALSGLYFYRTRQKLQVVESHSKTFQDWVKTHIPSVKAKELYDPTRLTTIRKIAARVNANRKERREDRLQILRKKFEQGEVGIEQVHSRVKAVKFERLQRVVHPLVICSAPQEKWQAILEEEMGFPMPHEIVQLVRSLSLKKQAREANPSTGHIGSEMGDTMPLEQIFSQFCDRWIASQSTESLLASYADHQSVLEHLIRNSLIEMVQKKQQIEKQVLTVKTTLTGISTSLSFIVSTVVLVLAIMALASNPVGAAALILTLLTVSSILINLSLVGRGYYVADRQTVGLSPTTFYATRIRLASYQALAAIASLKSTISASYQNVWQRNKEVVANKIKQLPLVHRLCRKNPESVELQNITVSENPSSDVDPAEYWRKKAISLEEELEVTAWKDFAKRANLQTASSLDAFDSLKALLEALKQADFDLLNHATKELFERELGIPIIVLQEELTKDPQMALSRLRHFFNLDHNAYAKFLSQQGLSS